MRLRNIVAAMIAAVLIGAFASTTAQAAVSDCTYPTVGLARICFYEDPPYQKDGGHGFFARTADEVLSPPDGNCMNLNTHYWHDGVGIVGDYASSLVVNSHTGAQAPNGLVIKFYEWVNCNESARSFALGFSTTPQVAYIPYLSNITNLNGNLIQQNEGTNFNDTIMSVRVIQL